MNIPYDEIFFSTRREIAVCESSIAELKKDIASMERKYGLNTTEFLGDPGRCGIVEKDDARRWRESSDGLRIWERRLRELKEILED